ncbi:response regulator [Parvibium lacunae]|uniref:Response regulator n=1 Tax=Parvibium lacunae TaxID=1888893 RepID=A0A368L7Q8_9BURK|nr:response regulator [Parvibium lacunae]RCS59656.1 response regulator [Parvibium lacunae]
MEQKITSHTVEILGFTERERILFSSIFRLSQLRTHRYHEPSRGDTTQPDCLVLDSNLPDYAQQLAARLSAQPALIVLVVFDQGAPRDVPCATVNRPIRWSEFLLALDNQVRALHNQKANEEQELVEDFVADEGIDAIANEVEISSISDWFEHQEPITFQTAPGVLVVDPDEASFLYISAKLAGQLYRVDWAKSAEEALDFLTLNRYNIVISDTELPDRDGIALCGLIKKRQDRRRTATILLTHDTSLLRRAKAAMAGCDAYFVKPISPENLERTMQKFLPSWRMTNTASMPRDAG